MNGLLLDISDESMGTVPGNSSLFIEFISQIEGWKTRCKNLHWAAERKNIHVYLDEFLDILTDYQDGLAEGYMGILGKMSSSAINGTAASATDPWSFILEVRQGTLRFYNSIPEDPVYSGIKSECETFIQNINKYNYLFSLCDKNVQ